MAAILGISGQFHDAAAALVIGGKVVVAIQEERLSRIKHDASLPLRAARACLDFARLDAQDLDAVVFYENPYAKLERVLTHSLERSPWGMRSFPGAMASQLGNKLWVLDALAQQLGLPRNKISYQDHHHSHAASAFYTSGFSRAAVLTIDGVGEDTCSALWLGEGNTLRCLQRQRFPHSVGLLYAAITAYLGFEVNEGEYKVMGLASFGRPLFRQEFSRFARCSEDGVLELQSDYFAHFENHTLGFGPKLERLLGPRRAYGKPFDFSQAESQRAADIAATAQAVVEEAVLAMVQMAHRQTGCEALCLAGGVALNCSANARIARDGPFTRLWVHPAAGDAGGALGAALLTSVEHGDNPTGAMTRSDWGLAVDMSTLTGLAGQLGIPFRGAADPVEDAAEALLAGKVVAWVQGRFEWGPRALGHRSLLALPSAADTKERVNRVIKKREPFRPFAPAVLANNCSTFFHGQPDALTAFMTTTRKVQVARANEIPAVIHVDGTSRVQTVLDDGRPLGALLSRIGNASGAPVLLNTSLNGAGDPIAASAEDALEFFLSHPVDVMVVEDCVFERRLS